MAKNPTSDAFEKEKTRVLSTVTNPQDRLDIMKIKIETETKETASTGGGSGSFVQSLSFKAPKLTMFSDEAPKETQSKGGEVKEDGLKGGLADNKTLKQIANKHSDKISSLRNQLKIGVKIEMEHTNDKDIAFEIAMDHLMEDPNYYTNLNKIEKGEFKEMTGSASSGSYVGASFLAKSQSKKDWRGAAKPMYKGGKFVRVKKKCKTFPYCNQGDIKALDLWEDDKLKEAIKNVAKSKNVHENVVRAIVLHEIEEQLFTK